MRMTFAYSARSGRPERNCSTARMRVVLPEPELPIMRMFGAGCPTRCLTRATESSRTAASCPTTTLRRSSKISRGRRGKGSVTGRALYSTGREALIRFTRKRCGRQPAYQGFTEILEILLRHSVAQGLLGGNGEARQDPRKLPGRHRPILSSGEIERGDRTVTGLFEPGNIDQITDLGARKEGTEIIGEDLAGRIDDDAPD